MAVRRFFSLSSSSSSSSSSQLFRRLPSPPSSSTTANGLRVHNSLTRCVEPFRQFDTSKPVTWYACGPTVYDHAHLGHARTYVGFDIIRRIMKRQFGLSVVHVMGVTDIDDKIIARAQERGLSIKQLASQFEVEFKQDMHQLRVDPPQTFIRVTDVVPEIVEYIKTIETHGYAYRTEDGSVYFDVQRYNSKFPYFKLATETESTDELDSESSLAAAHSHSSSSPSWSSSAQNQQAKSRGKKSPLDFALWKSGPAIAPPSSPIAADFTRPSDGATVTTSASGADGCTFPSPWGPGRPGWHIECSVMSTLAFGESLDIHSGGIDLKVIHHNNEIAQCCAHSLKPLWARYFLHAGHLHIQGHKMSKSLKNFITIREFLQQYSSDQFRMFCLMHHYTYPVDFSADVMVKAAATLKRYAEFFHSVQVFASSNYSCSWRDREDHLLHSLQKCQEAIHNALADDFNTTTAIGEINKLVSSVFDYLRDDAVGKHTELVVSICNFVSETLDMFGLELPSSHSLSSSVSISSSASNSQSGAALEALVKFRQDVRSILLSKPFDAASARSSLLSLCDSVRNQVMPSLGVVLKDSTTGKSECRAMTADEFLQFQQSQRQQQQQPPTQK